MYWNEERAGSSASLKLMHKYPHRMQWQYNEARNSCLIKNTPLQDQRFWLSIRLQMYLHVWQIEPYALKNLVLLELGWLWLALLGNVLCYSSSWTLRQWSSILFAGQISRCWTSLLIWGTRCQSRVSSCSVLMTWTCIIFSCFSTHLRTLLQVYYRVCTVRSSQWRKFPLCLHIGTKKEMNSYTPLKTEDSISVLHRLFSTRTATSDWAHTKFGRLEQYK